MERIRLAIKKDGALRFLSHLDFARAVRYVIIRAQLPVCYSEGFNPHMKVSFASALGVGVSANLEYMDMELSEKLPVDVIIERMNTQSPEGFSVTDGKYIAPKAPKLMAIANYAVYDMEGPLMEEISQEDVIAIMDRFNEASHITFEKVSLKGKHRTRTIEVKNHVVEPIKGTVKGNRIIITCGILRTDDGAIKPQQVWDVLATQFHLPVQTDLMLAHRKSISVRQNGHDFSLFHFGC